LTVEDDAESYNHKVDSQERKQCEYGIGRLDVMMSRIWALLPRFGMFDLDVRDQTLILKKSTALNTTQQTGFRKLHPGKRLNSKQESMGRTSCRPKTACEQSLQGCFSQ